MDAGKPLTEEEVKQLILKFWKLDEEKAHIVDLMEVTAPDLEIGMGDFAWHGYRGLGAHQTGSKGQYFDEHFEPQRASRSSSTGERRPRNRRCNGTPATGLRRRPGATRSKPSTITPGR